MQKKTLLSWSSGKDSAWTLHTLNQDPNIEVVGIFSVLNERYNRVSMHATRENLLNRQAEAAGLELHCINLPDECSDEKCSSIMAKFVSKCLGDKIECIAFGDLHLEEVRKYREKQMSGTGINVLLPLWNIPTKKLAHTMLTEGLEAYISSVDLNKLPASFAGRKWTAELLKELPLGIDPCGENGEIHTIVVDGPMFKNRILITIGEIVQRDGFAYADIIPVC